MNKYTKTLAALLGLALIAFAPALSADELTAEDVEAFVAAMPAATYDGQPDLRIPYLQTEEAQEVIAYMMDNRETLVPIVIGLWAYGNRHNEERRDMVHSVLTTLDDEGLIGGFTRRQLFSWPEERTRFLAKGIYQGHSSYTSWFSGYIQTLPPAEALTVLEEEIRSLIAKPLSEGRDARIRRLMTDRAVIQLLAE